eukprot:4589793-Amphidinium_carterae.1
MSGCAVRAPETIDYHGSAKSETKTKVPASFLHARQSDVQAVCKLTAKTTLRTEHKPAKRGAGESDREDMSNLHNAACLHAGPEMQRRQALGFT